MIRIRTRGESTSVRTKEKAKNEVTLFGSPLSSYVELTGDSIIPFDDVEIHEDDDDGWNKFNPCHHQKNHDFVIELPGVEAVSTAANLPQYYGMVKAKRRLPRKIPGSIKPFAINPSSYLKANHMATGMSAVDWKGLVSEVGSKLDGRMQTGNNLIVEIAQLAGTVDMLRHPFRLAQASKKLFGSRSLGMLAKSSASKWLELNFGWKNLYLGMRDFSRVIQEVRKHKEFLKESEQRWTRYGARESTNVVFNRSLGSGYGWNIAWDYTDFALRIPKYRIQRDATFSVYSLRPSWSHNFSSFELAMQRLGVTDVLGTLWELVPFSFVVNWFVNLNSCLVTNPSYYAYLYKLKLLGFSQRSTLYGTIEAKESVQVLGSVKSNVSTSEHALASRYDRDAGFPLYSGTICNFSGINLTQLGLGISLIAQRIL